MLFSVLTVGILIGLVRGGKITNMTHIKIQYPWLIFLSILMEYGLLLFMRSTALITQPAVFATVFVQYLLLFAFLWMNRNLSFAWLVGAGSFLNFLVIILNKGSMPLSEAALLMDTNSRNMDLLINGKYLTYHIVNEKTIFAFLGDVIYLPSPFKAFLSIGDIVLFIGIMLLIQGIIAGKTGKAKAA